MRKPLKIKLRQGDEVTSMAPLTYGSLAADNFLVVTKQGHFYRVSTSTDLSLAEEIWIDHAY